MLRRISRRSWLIALAVSSLIFWAAVAVGVALVATDALDLGLESFIRRYEATVVASLGGEPAGATPTPSAPSQPSLSGSGAPGAQPGGTQDGRQPGDPTPAANLGQPAQPNRTPSPTQPAPAQPAQPPSSSPAASLPLVLADPPLADLQGLDAEMSRSALGRTVQIRYQEAALNREVEAFLSANPDLPYRDVWIDLQEDGMLVTARVTLLGVAVKTRIQGTVVARDCQPQAEVQSVSIAAILTPRFVTDAVKGMVQDALGWYPSAYPFCLDQIVLEEDAITLHGHRR